MIRLPEIWECLQKTLPRDVWHTLDSIYDHVEHRLKPDEEDYEPQAPNSNIPKWKRNVRNVLQYRKKTGEIDWDGKGQYMLRARK